MPTAAEANQVTGVRVTNVGDEQLTVQWNWFRGPRPTRWNAGKKMVLGTQTDRMIAKLRGSAVRRM